MQPPKTKTSYLRPMTAAEIFSDSFRLYWDHLALLVMVGLVPHLLLGFFLMTLPKGEEIVRPEAAVFIWGLMFIGILLNGLVLAALTVATAGAALGREMKVLEIYSRTFRAKPGRSVATFLIVNFVVSLVLMPALLSGNPVVFMISLVPTLIVGGILFPALPIVIVEQVWTPKAIYRSVSLCRPIWARAGGVFSYFLLISGFFPLIILSILLALQDNMTGLFTPLLGGIIAAVTLPLGFAAVVLFYFSLRSGDEAGRETLRRQLEILCGGAEDFQSEDPPSEDPPSEDPPSEDPASEDPASEDPPSEDPASEDPPPEADLPKRE